MEKINVRMKDSSIDPGAESAYLNIDTMSYLIRQEPARSALRIAEDLVIQTKSHYNRFHKFFWKLILGIKIEDLD